MNVFLSFGNFTSSQLYLFSIHLLFYYYVINILIIMLLLSSPKNVIFKCVGEVVPNSSSGREGEVLNK